MTRNDMRRLDATDDPRPMSVSEDEKKGGQPGGEKVVQRDEHEVFFFLQKLQQGT